MAGVASTWYPTADAHVRTGSAERKNFGADAVMEVRSSTKEGTSEAYLRFDLSMYVSSVDSAKLRIFARLVEPGTASLLVRSVASADWQEYGVNWKNKPDQANALGVAEIVGISHAWYEVDLTRHLQGEVAAGRRIVDLALIMSGASQNKIQIYSRDAQDHRPELVVERPLFNAKVIFQPPGIPIPEGYCADHGQRYGVRTNGLSYGWDMDNTQYVRDRGPAKDKTPPSIKGPDRRYDMFAYFEHSRRPQSAKWEIAVPNGPYRVRIVSGDAQHYDSVFAVDAEGVLVVDGVPDKNKRWLEGTKTVRVRDGRLTLSSNKNGSNNKVTFVEIAEQQP